MFKADTDIFDTDFIIKLTAGEALSARDAVYISTADGKAYKCDADDATKVGFIGFVVESAAINTTVSILDWGHMGGFSGLTINGVYFLSGTPGAISTTPGTYKIIVGHAYSASVIKKHTGFLRHERIVYTTTGSNTWTKRNGLAFVDLEVQAGGGGGDGTGGDSEAAGGGGGGFGKKRIYANSLGSTETATVGVAGAAGDATPTFGGSGGTSSFGTHISCTGGAGGNDNGGAGGTCTGGDIAISGQNGGPQSSNGGTAGGTRSGSGGDSFYGHGGQQPDDANGVSGSGYGSGGSGGLSFNSTNYAGGPGTQGIIIVDEYYVF